VKAIDLREAKATLFATIDAAEAGEPVTITRHGKAVAVVVPVADAERLHPTRGNFGAFLMSFPGLPDAIEIERNPSHGGEMDL
jgi:prevent-host-death family protein